jgi:hypothetical protein
MAARFKDDSFQPPNWAQDGLVPKQLDPLYGVDPQLPDWPPKTPPAVPGYPWWLDPYGFPTLPPRRPGPSDFPLPPTLQGPTSAINPAQDASPNRLLSYYNQMLAQQGIPQPVKGLDPVAQDDPQPKRWLGTRSYRA